MGGDEAWEEQEFHREMREQMRDLKATVEKTNSNVNRLYTMMSALKQWSEDHQKDDDAMHKEVEELKTVKNKLYGAVAVVSLAVGAVVAKVFAFFGK